MRTTESLGAIEKLLSQKHRQLIEKISRLQKNKRRGGKILSADSSEQAVELQNDEVVDSMDQIEHLELEKVQKALLALSDGTYGLCHDCGEIISDTRIKAMPLTIYCIECAK